VKPSPNFRVATITLMDFRDDIRIDQKISHQSISR
jgi:hypothetical protein